MKEEITDELDQAESDKLNQLANSKRFEKKEELGL
tara:strand:- start:1619 stop:1723 length:105 start_codon:yes stop_codon:yes gene_type:complete